MRHEPIKITETEGGGEYCTPFTILNTTIAGIRLSFSVAIPWDAIEVKARLLARADEEQGLDLGGYRFHRARLVRKAEADARAKFTRAADALRQAAL